MEFKGTKGKWFIDKKKEHVNKFGSKVNVLSSTQAQELCHVYNIDYNALLISKAPEMLEKLQEIVDNWKSGNEDNFIMANLIDDAEQIINEATEI